MLYGICSFLFSIVETTIVAAVLNDGHYICTWEIATCVTRTIGIIFQGYLYRYTNPSFACRNETRNLTRNNVLLPLTMFSLLSLAVKDIIDLETAAGSLTVNIRILMSFAVLIRTLFYFHLFLHFVIINVRLYISVATRNRADINNANGAHRNDDYQILPDVNDINDAGGERRQVIE